MSRAGQRTVSQGAPVGFALSLQAKGAEVRPWSRSELSTYKRAASLVARAHDQDPAVGCRFGRHGRRSGRGAGHRGGAITGLVLCALGARRRVEDWRDGRQADDEHAAGDQAGDHPGGPAKPGHHDPTPR